MRIKKVSVLGAGLMGKQIALLVAKSGYSVMSYTRSRETLEKAKQYIDESLDKSVRKGKLSEQEITEIKERIVFTNDLEQACESTDLVIECIVENEEAKKNILHKADQITPKHVIYATNSSYIVSSRLKESVSDPSNLLNLHVFNPASAMKVAEVVKGPHVSDETFETVCEFAETIGKTPIRVEKEIYGFVVNRIFSALTKEACQLVDQGVASIEDIDRAVKGGLGHAMGPLETLDMTGIDLEYDVYMERFRKSGDPADRPAACLVERWARGEYGRKAGKGFYDYEEEDSERNR